MQGRWSLEQGVRSAEVTGSLGTPNLNAGLLQEQRVLLAVESISPALAKYSHLNFMGAKVKQKCLRIFHVSMHPGQCESQASNAG